MRALVITFLLAVSILCGEYKVMDVSVHNGVIDWTKVKNSGINGVIIRCGYGSDIVSQDDERFHYNVQGCIDNGIPFGIYLYSYAYSEEQARSEAAHVMRLVNPYKNKLSLPVYYDLEENGTQDVAVRNGKIFLEILKNKGYAVGVTGTESWFNYYFKDHFNGYSLWVAKYGPDDGYPHNSPNIYGVYDMWQYSSKCRVSGVSTNVDLSICYRDIPGISGTPWTPSASDDIHNKTIDQ